MHIIASNYLITYEITKEDIIEGTDSERSAALPSHQVAKSDPLAPNLAHSHHNA